MRVEVPLDESMLDSETLEELTVYRGSHGGLWARPRAMFEDGRFTREEE